MAQQTLKDVDQMFKSFFALIKLAKQGKYNFKHIKLPNYLPKNGYRFNADCNGALNILRKSKAVDLTVLCRRGELDTPKRIRIF